ncbi:MAG: glycoside hydrolase family 130 protein [Candidatus Eisenbacteria bacterium]|nr:glycoside hydrolase family 130 protein [Candidatus Eisenbacteria bacterium]
MALVRSAANPILTRRDVPAVPPRVVDPTSVFNPGAVRHAGAFVLLLRVQTRGRETHLMVARGADGERFEVEPRVVELAGVERVRGCVHHVYDPRVTPLGGSYLVTVAMDVDDRCLSGLARTDDFDRFEFLGVTGDADVRNVVLFPERVGGRYLRLARPNTVAAAGAAPSGDTIVLEESDDLLRWRAAGEVMRGRFHSWDELIGAGPPPLKTREGWLVVYHGVATHLSSAHIYQAGVALLDLADPSRVLARSRNNILEPREPYEHVGQVPNVVFPTGLVVDRVDPDGFAPADARAFLYYGAADLCVCLATATVGDLVAACHD